MVAAAAKKVQCCCQQPKTDTSPGDCLLSLSSRLHNQQHAITVQLLHACCGCQCCCGLLIGLLAAASHRLTPRHTAYLRVAEGCNHACTFCAIPGFRGKFRSKAWGAVLEEAQRLVASGVVELNLIAEDTNQYGQDRCAGHWQGCNAWMTGVDVSCRMPGTRVKCLGWGNAVGAEELTCASSRSRVIQHGRRRHTQAHKTLQHPFTLHHASQDSSSAHCCVFCCRPCLLSAT
jgi:hypothetical protein